VDSVKTVLKVEKMEAAKLAPKTIVNYTQVVKLVVASAVDPNGDQIYLRKWNHHFIGLPIIEPNKQRRPTVSKVEFEEILASANRRWGLLFALLAGTGLRIALLALQCFDVFRQIPRSELHLSIAWRGTHC
jgi:integrase